MMKYYLDITFLPGAEDNLGFIWQKVYQKVHLAIVENKTIDGDFPIAVCFPKYGDKQFPLGNVLRLFAETEELFIGLNITQALNQLKDYTHCTSIKEAPFLANQFACVRRKQFDTNIDRIARRRAKRKRESFEQAKNHLSGFKDKETNLPFINIESFSKGGRFKLFIKQEIVTQALAGKFNCYGLSQGGTVPFF